jgi:hypothetical protein
MKGRLAALTVVALLLGLAPTASADQAPLSGSGEAPAACLAATDAASPPCGYIVPTISLDFPEKPVCRAETLGGSIDLSKCMPLPPVGETRVQEGWLRFSWDISQDGAYPPDAACVQSSATGGTEGCIVVTFSGTATNPKWIGLAIEPTQVVLDAQTMSDPDNLKVTQETQSVVVLVEVPLTVTFTRKDVGAEDDSIARIERAQGATAVFLKAKSSASGQYYKEAFGVEEFRFDPCANDDGLSHEVKQCTASSDASKQSPGLGLVGLLAAIGTGAIMLRRRRA